MHYAGVSSSGERCCGWCENIHNYHRQQAATDYYQPNGTLGRSVIHHLKEAGFNITLLTRNPETTAQEYAGLRAIQVNYDSAEALTKTLREDVGSMDALVILINRDQLQPQLNLMDAAIAAHIPYIIPSSFGIGSRDQFLRSLPIWDTKVQMEDYVERKMQDVCPSSFTGIQTGVFLDWALEKGVFLNFDKNGPMGGATMVFDRGDVPFSGTVMNDIGRSVVAVLLKADQLRNRSVFVHSAVVTQNQLLTYAREAAPNIEFKVIPMDTAEMEKQAREKYDRGDRSIETMRGFMPRATFGKGMGLFKETDNQMLGIDQWTDQEVKQLVARYIRR